MKQRLLCVQSTRPMKIQRINTAHEDYSEASS
jgi:hypothetical protein